MLTEGTKIAVVDDDESSARIVAGIVEEVGFVPRIISESVGPFESVETIVSALRNLSCTAAICDHRLTRTQFAEFTGAELAARLYELRIPNVLISTFSAIDSDTSIKLHRELIPSVIDRGDLDPIDLLIGLKRCEKEIYGAFSPDRLATRTLLRVLGVSTESDMPVADAIMHSWNPNHAVRFPVELIEDAQISRKLMRLDNEMRLFAEVNIGCSEDYELFFRSFELAPEPTDDDL